MVQRVRVNKRYSSLGIYEPWLEFSAFRKDVGERPDRMTIERIDNGVGYFPGNVRWASVTEQNRHKGDTVNVTMNGRTMCLAEWIRELGVSKHAVYKRVNSLGWHPVDALTVPVKVLKFRPKEVA